MRSLVEEALAADGATETRNAVSGVHLALELVVVREFFVCTAMSVTKCAPQEAQETHLSQCP